MQNNGKLIVIDGLDGSGKSTQFQLIQEKLREDRINFKAISFPNYEDPSSALIRMYLNGDLSKNADGVNAYAASSFYAVDRYASYKLYWEKEYVNGTLILASRYVSSNAIHQMAKLPENEWYEFLRWLGDYEFVKLDLPKPNMTIFLDMPTEISSQLLSERYGGDESKKDIHESNIAYLNACRRSALYTARIESWRIVKCSEDGSPLSKSNILAKIMKEIYEVF